MNNITLSEIDLVGDFDLISEWDNHLSEPKFKSIFDFILEEGLILNLKELITTNFEQYPIGDDERKNIIVAKNSEAKIVAFLILSTHDLSTDSPEIFLQHIVIHPDYQAKGMGTEILSKLGECLTTLYGKEPKTMFAYISQYNHNSRNLFKKFGFKFKVMDLPYLKAYGDMPTKLKAQEK